MNEMTLLVNAARTDPILRDAALAVEKRLLEAQRSYETAERAAVMWMERAEAAEAALAEAKDAAWIGSQIALCEEFIRAAKNDDTFGVEDIEAKLILLTQAER